MGESWLVDVETSVMMMAMISPKSPSRQGARTELLVPELGFSVAAAQWNSFVENNVSPGVFRSGGFIQREGEVELVPEAATHTLGAAKPGPRLGHVWAPRGSSPSRLLAP